MLRNAPQFGMAALFEFITVWAVLAALSSLSGIVPAIFLAGMAVALTARQGVGAIIALAAALLAADVFPQHPEQGSFLRQVSIIAIAISLCAWYRWRHARSHLASRRESGDVNSAAGYSL